VTGMPCIVEYRQSYVNCPALSAYPPIVS